MNAPLEPRTDIAHSWDLSPREAIALQKRLAGQVVAQDTLAGPPRRVAGIDVGLRRGSSVARAAAVVLTLPELHVVDEAVVEQPVTFPYVPGLLSFREAPAILACLAHLSAPPDVLIFDGQGLAHPRRLGIASHVGILLDLPSLGCAKSRLCGEHEEPAASRGDYALLRAGDEVIGAVLRTRTAVRPVFVSVGHRLSLPTAIALVLACGAGYRLPEPTRLAHRLASGLA